MPRQIITRIRSGTSAFHETIKVKSGQFYPFSVPQPLMPIAMNWNSSKRPREILRNANMYCSADLKAILFTSHSFPLKTMPRQLTFSLTTVKTMPKKLPFPWQLLKLCPNHLTFSSNSRRSVTSLNNHTWKWIVSLCPYMASSWRHKPQAFHARILILHIFHSSNTRTWQWYSVTCVASLRSAAAWSRSKWWSFSRVCGRSLTG